MGQSELFRPIYATQKGYVEGKGESGVFRLNWDKPSLDYRPAPAIQNLQDLWSDAVRRFGAIKFLGQIVQSGEGGGSCYKNIEYSVAFKTFSQVNQLSRAFGVSVLKKELAPQTQKDVCPFGIFSKNCLNWVVVDLACVIYGLTSVPLYDSLTAENITYVLEQTELRTIYCGIKELQKLATIERLGKLSTVIVEQCDSKLESLLVGKKLRVMYFSQLIKQGKGKYEQPKRVDPNHPFTISYTSGTTGNPKGAVLSQMSMLAATQGFSQFPYMNVGPEDRYLSYLPLPHIFQRGMLYCSIWYGSNMTFFRGDTLKLLQDLKIVKPTVFVTVPRIFNKVYQSAHSQFAQLTGIKKSLVESALQSKEQQLIEKQEFKSAIYDALVFSKIKQQLGGCVRLAVVGSAPIQGKVLNFMRMSLGCPVVEAYGQTESMGCFFLTHQKDVNTGIVGGPNACTQFKLEDIPQMQYTSGDIIDGVRVPRGQILIRGPGLFRGYFKDPANTNQTLTKDGWLHTGDVGQVVPGTNSLKIIDRKKNIFKLAQGEYVVPIRTQNSYVTNSLFSELWLHGDSLQSFCVLLAVVLDPVLEKYAREKKIAGSADQLRKNKDLKKIILQQINGKAKSQGITSFSMAKNICLLKQSFGTRDCLTNTMKMQRFKATKRYAEQIKQLYTEGDLISSGKP